MKDTDKQPGEEVRSRRVLSVELLSPWPCSVPPSLHVGASTNPESLTRCDALHWRLKLPPDIEGRALSLASEELSINTRPTYC